MASLQDDPSPVELSNMSSNNNVVATSSNIPSCETQVSPDRPVSPGTPESEEDCWMPELPPAMVDPATADAEGGHHYSYTHKKVNELYVQMS